MKKKVTYKPNKWDQDDFQTYKMTLRKQYEVLQESEKLYLAMSDHGNQRWFMKKCFDVVEPKTPCPADWQPAEGYSVSDYEAECINSGDESCLTIGKFYKLEGVTDRRLIIYDNNNQDGACFKYRFATPTLRASAKPKETEQITLNDEEVRAIADAVDNPNPPSETLKDAKVRYQEFKGNEPETVFTPDGTKVRCIKPFIAEGKVLFTQGDIYEVYDKMGEHFYSIKTNLGHYTAVGVEHFEVVDSNESNQPDPVNHPMHYNQNGYEVKDLIAAFNLNFFRGNVVKYACRAHLKGAELQDLMKVKANIDFEIERMTNGKGAPITVEMLLGIIYDCVDKIKEMQAQHGTING